MPDLLHQLKKGIWSHILDWFIYLLHDVHGVRTANQYADEFDKRFTLIPNFTNIKRFPKGIRHIEYITAGEYADIMKVFIKYPCIYEFFFFAKAILIWICYYTDIFTMCSRTF